MIDLALIDLTPISCAVISAAHTWGSSNDMQVHLLHDLEPKLPALADAASRAHWFQLHEAKARDLARVIVQEALDEDGSMPLHVSHKQLAPTIARLHERLHIRTLFTGMKSAGNLQRFLAGSSIIKILEEFNIPLVAIPQAHVLRGQVDLHVAVTHEHAFHPGGLTNFVTSHLAMIRSVQYFSVDPPGATDDRNRKMLEQLVERTQLPIPCGMELLEGDDLPEILKRKLVKAPAGMLVMQKGSRKLLDHLTRRFLVDRMIHDGSIPLIVLS